MTEGCSVRAKLKTAFINFSPDNRKKRIRFAKEMNTYDMYVHVKKQRNGKVTLE